MILRRASLLLAGLVLTAAVLPAQTIDTWVTSQGAMFEASVKTVTPGQVTFTLKDGREQTVPIQDLSERSRGKLVEALGLGGAPVTPAPATAAASTSAPTPAPAAPASAPTSTAAPMATQPADGAAIDVTDAAQIQAKMGQQAIIVGTVSRVPTLGASGHRLIEFENSNFNVFISRQQIEQSADWVLDDLPGKRLQVSGTLETYRDAPQIRGTNPSQLTRVE